MTKHAVKYPSELGTIISVTCSTVIAIYSSSRLWNGQEGDLSTTQILLLCVLGGCILLCAWVWIRAVRREMKGPSDLELEHDTILLNGRRIHAKDIARIMVRGYFRPVIGIQPHGKKRVPVHMSFKFLEEDRGTADLQRWAEQHHIQMVNKFFHYGV